MSGKKNAYNISYEAVSELSLDLAYGSTDQNDILLTQENPFADPIVAEYYKEVYEKAGYECRDAFDPLFEWSKSEEDNIIRKLDYRVALTACILFAGLQIDRGNLGQAVSDNMLDDLGLDTNNYNTGNTIFLVCFLLAELPSQLISKALGPDIFIPIQIVTWSVVAMSQGIIKGKLSFYLTRGLIGMLEGGFIADIVLWLLFLQSQGIAYQTFVVLDYFILRTDFYFHSSIWNITNAWSISISRMALVVYIGGIMYFLHWLNLLFFDGTIGNSNQE